MRWLLVALSALALTQSATAAVTDATYADTVGDAQLGAADISEVTVIEDKSRLGIRVSYGDRTCATGGDVVVVDLDVDRNPRTGDSRGIDYVLFVDVLGGRRGIIRWNGSSFQPFSVQSLRAGCDGRGFDYWNLPRLQIRITRSFDFRVSTCLDSARAQCGDTAPDALPTWTYRVSSPPPPPSPPPRTLEDAPLLPKRDRYVGASVRHARLAPAIYAAMKVAGGGRQLQVVCWSKADWPSVVESIGGRVSTGRAVLVGFWHPKQPRVLHLSPKACKNVQALITTRELNRQRAAAAAAALHETAHMYGVRNEAEASCYAVQLVYYLARELRFGRSAALRLERLAVRAVRASSPRGYWDADRCRDGGTWDLDDETSNLDH